MSYLQWDIGTAVLSSYDDDGFLTIQVDAYGEGDSGVVPYEAHAPSGFISRPHDPDEDGGCQILYALEGGRGHAWALSDPRVIPLLPPVKKGGAAMYGGPIKTPGFFYIDGETASQTFYVPYAIDGNGVAQKAMSIEINVDQVGSESISLIHGSGAAMTMVTEGSSAKLTMRNAKGDAWISLGDDGTVMNGPVVVQGSMTSGGASGVALVSFPQFSTMMQALLKIVGAINASTTGAPAAALSTQLAGMATKLTKGA